ncbi:hypothetical protein R0G64_01435 [Pseudomonas otitidis]|uniref:Uncharacterized protein n=1 Tax=Metapseudomonas otitidis TaxID=319939 RepID=A0ABU3XJH4_9GAMM|nr:hypothetical protein [Pseudomonas otitidis]MDV3438088.1 hypothetical protein [Pseudomonas otitidis]
MELAPEQVPAEMDLPVGCKLVDGAIEFESLEVRNSIIATAAYDYYFSSDIDSNALFEHAFGLWRHEIGHNDQASGRLLALAAVSVDVLLVGAQQIRSGKEVFNILHLIEAALPYLDNLDTQSIIDLIAAKHEPTKNDMLAGAINGALERWLEKHPKVATRLHAKTLESLTEATSSLLGNAIIALSKSDYSAAVAMTKGDVRSSVHMQAQVGTWTLGRLLLDENAAPKEINSVVDSVKNLIESNLPEIRREAIRAAVGAMHRLAAFDEILLRLAEHGDQDVLCAAANALFLKNKEIQARGITQRWLQLLSALKPEFKGAIRNLDWAMSKLLSERGYVDIVLSALSQWVANHGQQPAVDSGIADLFDDTIHVLFSLDGTWSLLLTDWLLSERREHVLALEEILTQFSVQAAKELSFDKGRLDQLSGDDLLFLARRMLGYIHDRAQLTSLALSMLQSRDVEKRIYPLLQALLVDEIGYDYPGSTVDALSKAADEVTSVSHQSFLRTAAEAISRTLELQRALPSINELRPPASLRRLLSRARAKQMANSREEASKDSIWRQIATEIPIKAGMGAFSYRDSSYGSPMKLSSISHSFELPRREVFDPIGNSLRRLEFRIAKRDEP